MTQNPYGPPPGGAYPPQYPPMPPGQGWPPGYPAADVAGNPYQQAPPSPFTQQGQAGPPAGDPFDNPGAPTGGGGDQPGMHQLGGRLLLIRPKDYNPTAPPHPSSTQGPGPLVMAELIVCDGPPLEGNINGDTDQFTPFASGPRVAPFYCGSMYIRGAVLPGQLEPFVAGRGQVLGRLGKGTAGKSGKPPWVLADPTEADRVLGRQIHAQWDQIKAAAAPPRPDQFGAPVAPVSNGFAQQGPPPGYSQQPPANPYIQQGPPPGYGQAQPPNPYAQQAPPGYPQQQQYPPY